MPKMRQLTRKQTKRATEAYLKRGAAPKKPAKPRFVLVRDDWWYETEIIK